MLWLEILIVVIAVSVIIFSFPKLKVKYLACSPETKERLNFIVPLIIAIIGAFLLLSIVR